MSGRIWPGALCYITHPTLFGRMVEALHEAPVGVRFRLPDGYMHDSVPPGLWLCKSLGQPFDVQMGAHGIGRRSEWATVQAHWLRPILPPPGTESTEDRAPIEGEIVGV